MEVEDIVLSRDAVRFIIESYLGGQDAAQPLVSPVCADLRGLPPLLIQVGEGEYLRDGCVTLSERARAAGVAVELEVWPGMWHVWQLCAPGLPEGREAIVRVGRFVRNVMADQSAKMRA